MHKIAPATNSTLAVDLLTGASPCPKAPLKTKKPSDNSTSTANIPVCLSASIIRVALPSLSPFQLAHIAEFGPADLPLDPTLPPVVAADLSMRGCIQANRSRLSGDLRSTGAVGPAA